MDLSMPVVNGWEALLHLSEDPVTQRIQAIVIVATAGHASQS
jgi:CheY-like chemotaxis protein